MSSMVLQRLPHAEKLLGAKVRPVTSGTPPSRDAMNEAMRDWVTKCRQHLPSLALQRAASLPLLVREAIDRA